MDVAPGKNEQTPISECDENHSVDKSKKRQREEKIERRHDRSRDKRRCEERRDEERKHRKHHEKKQIRDWDYKREHQNRDKGVEKA